MIRIGNEKHPRCTNERCVDGIAPSNRHKYAEVCHECLRFFSADLARVKEERDALLAKMEQVEWERDNAFDERNFARQDEESARADADRRLELLKRLKIHSGTWRTDGLISICLTCKSEWKYDDTEWHMNDCPVPETEAEIGASE